jgi:hypothetical protein
MFYTAEMAVRSHVRTHKRAIRLANCATLDRMRCVPRHRRVCSTNSDGKTDKALRRLEEAMPKGWALYAIQRTRLGQYAALVTSLGSVNAADLGQVTGYGSSIADAIESACRELAEAAR